VQKIIEKRKEHNLLLFLLFIDYKKASDDVDRDKLWEMMENKIPNYSLNTIKCIYRNTKLRIKFNDGPVQFFALCWSTKWHHLTKVQTKLLYAYHIAMYHENLL
jgi:hypothetical protein